MIGTSPQTMGGISSVVNAYRAGGLFERIPVSYISSHADGGAVTKLTMAAVAVCRFVGWLVFRPAFILHVHVSSRASFWRKMIFIWPALWTKKIVIFHLHGSEFMQFYLEECGPLKQRLVRAVKNRCSRNIVLSESRRQNVARITPNQNVTVLMNPALQPSAAASNQPRRGEVLLFLGRLGRRKGIYVLLQALVSVRLKFPDVRLICGGDGELEEVRAEIAKLGLEQHVDLLGWVKGEAKDELLAISTLYVLPSFDEGVPMSILEAMASGIPIVSTPVGGIPEVVGNGREGVLVPPGDVPGLSAAISRLLGDPGLRSRMGQNCLERFRRDFSIETVLDKLEQIYSSHGVFARPAKVTAGSN
jgi:glycosyltransferase involved in cell wall biosynthesis